MRVIIVFYFFCIGILALLAQMILPAHFEALSAVGFGSALVPLVVIYASMELGDERAPILAAIMGLLVDLTLHRRLGMTVLILVVLSALIVSQMSKPESHRWYFRLTFALIGTFAFYLADYFFALVSEGLWHGSLSAWSKIIFATLLNTAASPLFFYLIGLPPRLCGWKPDYELNERIGTYAR